MQLAVSIEVVPVGNNLGEIVWVGGGRPVHEVQVYIVDTEVLERRSDSFLDSVVPGVVELGGEPNLRARNAAGFDALSDFSLVAICKL